MQDMSPMTDDDAEDDRDKARVAGEHEGRTLELKNMLRRGTDGEMMEDVDDDD